MKNIHKYAEILKAKYRDSQLLGFILNHKYVYDLKTLKLSLMQKKVMVYTFVNSLPARVKSSSQMHEKKNSKRRLSPSNP